MERGGRTPQSTVLALGCRCLLDPERRDTIDHVGTHPLILKHPAKCKVFLPFFCMVLSRSMATEISLVDPTLYFVC